MHLRVVRQYNIATNSQLMSPHGMHRKAISWEAL